MTKIFTIAFAAIASFFVIAPYTAFAAEADSCRLAVDSQGLALIVIEYDGKTFFNPVNEQVNPEANGNNCFASAFKKGSDYSFKISWSDTPKQKTKNILKILFGNEGSVSKPQKVLFPLEPTMEIIPIPMPAPRVDNSTTSSIGGDESMPLNLDENEDMLSDIADANDALALAIAMKLANAK